MIRGVLALGSRVALLALLNCWALIGGVVLVGGSLVFAARLMSYVSLLFVVVVGGVILLAYRKDGLSAWNTWVGAQATQHSLLILLAAIVSSAGGIVLLQHGQHPDLAVAWVLYLSALVGMLETATVIMAMTNRK